MAHHSASQLKQGLNPYNVLVLCFLGLGSVTYGYTASIIGTTLGMSPVEDVSWLITDIARPTFIHRLLRARYPQQWHGPYRNNKWSFSSRRCHRYPLPPLVCRQIWPQVGMRSRRQPRHHIRRVPGRQRSHRHVHRLPLRRWRKRIHDSRCCTHPHERAGPRPIPRRVGRFTRRMSGVRICDSSVVCHPLSISAVPSILRARRTGSSY